MYSPTVNEKMSKLNNGIKSLLTPPTTPYGSPLTATRYHLLAERDKNYETAKEMKETFNSLVEHLNKTEFEVTIS